tara:strand:+ start:26 stop:556 length:531 start_codon:yes stop_codon:yes gene_type:complete
MIFSKIKNLFSSKSENDVKRNIRVHNIKTAKSIGILYEAHDKKNIEEIEVLVDFFFKENRKQVKSLGYVKGKKLENFHLPRLQYDFFLSKDLSWRPNSENYIIKNFLENEFDILINVSDPLINELAYLTKMSISNFKIGRYNENIPFFDFMIDLKGKGTGVFIKEVIKYIQVINIK